jgi:small subunit ribosomal protein S18
MAKKTPRTKNKDNARRSKKKTSVLVQESVEYIDYKDINLLRRFMSDRAKIRARRVTGNDAQQQREVARAIKNAREMALLPYTNRVTTQRTSRDRGPGGPGRADGPPPRPQGPPPSRDGEGDLDELDTSYGDLIDDLGADDENTELTDVPGLDPSEDES